MDFELSETRAMLKDTADRFLRDRYTAEMRHKAAQMDHGFDPAVWAEFADLGLIGALIPAEAGGYGGEGEDIALVFESLGRAIVVEPFLAQLLAATVLCATAPDRCEALVEGTELWTFAHGEPGGRYDPFAVATAAEERDGRWHLTGAKAVVPNGDAADHVIVSARTRNGLALFAVPGSADGLARRGFATIDGGRAAEMTLDATPATLLIAGLDAEALIERVLATGALAVAAEALGAMDVSRDMTLAYLKERKQFGKPIGANQVLQHRMVDLVMEIEQARSAVMLAASSLGADRWTRDRAVSAAKNLVGRTGRLVAEETIQMHGGIAMTWEYSLPHYAKRIIMTDHQFGDTDHHLERFIRLGREQAA